MNDELKNKIHEKFPAVTNIKILSVYRRSCPNICLKFDASDFINIKIVSYYTKEFIITPEKEPEKILLSLFESPLNDQCVLSNEIFDFLPFNYDITEILVFINYILDKTGNSILKQELFKLLLKKQLDEITTVI